MTHISEEAAVQAVSGTPCICLEMLPSFPASRTVYRQKVYTATDMPGALLSCCDQDPASNVSSLSSFGTCLYECPAFTQYNSQLLLYLLLHTHAEGPPTNSHIPICFRQSAILAEHLGRETFYSSTASI